MLAIGIRYLNGWAMASHPADRERPEWPPHPDRVFMALAAAHLETDGDDTEREALEWLERQSPPQLVASAHHARETVVSYVPVNDVASTKLGVLPEHRLRQARHFPVAVPENPVVHLIWDAVADSDQQATLAGLCRKVTCVGHSASLVQMWVEEAEAALEPTLVPTKETARYRLRIPGPGRLSQLMAQFSIGLRPTASLWSGYDSPPIPQPVDDTPGSVFDGSVLILKRVAGARVGLETTLQLTSALRDTAMAACSEQPPPEWVCGHQPDGLPSQRPHLAFLPLPHVGREHADGHLLGVAMAVPGAVSAAERRCLRDLLYDRHGEPRSIEIRFGHGQVWQVNLEEQDSRPLALMPETWTAAAPAQPAQRWATVTPIVFDRHPKSRKAEAATAEAEATIRHACLRVGLPEPADVILSPVSMFIGSPHARSFPMMQRKAGGNMHHTHAIITFPQPVRGPILVGAGRYRGYGLCRPLR